MLRKRSDSLPPGGGVGMKEYRMYCLDGDGKIGAGEWFDANDDADALAIVRAKRLSVRCEVWERTRLVGTVSAFCGE